MPIQAPNVDQILMLADNFGMDLTLDDAHSFTQLMAGLKASYDRLDELVEPRLPVKYPRAPGSQPQAAENPYNAWTFKTEIVGRPAATSPASAWRSRTTSVSPGCR
jgi:amidase